MRNLILFLVGFFSFSVHADEALLKTQKAKDFVQEMVRDYGFKKAEVVGALKEAKYQPQIIESMNRPYEKKSWDIYSKIFLTDKRLNLGLKFWQENQKALEDAEKKYQVPANIIVAILGVETYYGEIQGNHRVLDALTTLAFYYPKRAKFFTKELREYLLLCKEHKVSPVTYKGSYAGAIGMPQFMPSSYRYYAVDFTGNGMRDLVSNNRDVIGSVANYFHKHGWQKGKEVASPAVVTGNSYKKLKTNRRSPNYAYKKLIRLGIKPEQKLPKPPHKAGVIELDTKTGDAYWLAYHNFYVITRYNTSPQYALAVYLLSEQLKKGMELAKKNDGLRTKLG